MKILTNIQTSYLGGISQTLYNLVNSLKKSNISKIEIIGVEITSEPNSNQKGIRYHPDSGSVLKHISVNVETPYFGDVIRTVYSVDQIKNTYSELIDTYVSIIKRERPDLILINGTYYVPWSLFQAGSQSKIPMVLHYHGILTKETAHYEPKLQSLVREMERVFDNDRLFYIFPSKLAKITVEKEVFGHKIARTAIIPNSIPQCFFNVETIGSKKDVAFVGRWSAIKNPEFIKKISQYNKRKDGGYRFNVVSDKGRGQTEIDSSFGNVRFYDPMSSRRLAKFYGNMGVVLSPSFFETYGNVAQEAIAAGTPALVSKNMGVAEIFKELGLSQWIVDFKSTKNVYEKIKSVSGQPICHKIRELFKYNLNPQAINNRLIQVFKSI